MAPYRKLTYLPHVDGLRAVAILLVVIHHVWPDWLPGGYVGVDVFFVISGFIITRQIADEMQRGEFSYLEFLSRRARRLIPAAVVCFFLTAVASTVILAPEALIEFGNSLVAALAMVANIFFYATSGYFAAPSAEKPLLHTWSLAVEDQFYLTWPLLLLVMLRFLPIRTVVWTVLMLATASLAHAQLSTDSNPDYAFYWLFPRAFELLIGCTLAIATPPPKARYADVIAAAGLLTILTSACVLTTQSPLPGLHLLPCCLGTAACIWGSQHQQTRVGSLLSRPWALFVGKISYSLYLYHWPMLALTTYALGRAPDALQGAGLVAIAFLAATASWRLVEQRLTTAIGLRSQLPLPVLARTFAMASVVLLAGLALNLDNGWAWRLDEKSKDVYTAAATANPWHDLCDGEDRVFAHNSECTLGKARADGKFDFAVIGDSNADQFVPMLHQMALTQGAAGRQVTRSTCGPIIGLYRSRKRRHEKEEICAAFQAEVIKFIEANPSLRTVILTAAWQDYHQIPAALNGTGRLLNFEERPGQSAIDMFIATTVKLLRDRGLHVVIIGQIPWLEPYAMGCFARAAETKDFDQCATSRRNAERKIQESQDKFSAVASRDPKLQFIDMMQELCSPTSCSGFKDDVFLYRNQNHLNGTGSTYLAKYLKIDLLRPTSQATAQTIN